MRIETSAGKQFEARLASALVMRGEARLMIVLSGDVTLSEAAMAFDGLQWVKAIDERNVGVSTTYEGYSQLSTVARDTDGGVRVTLTRKE